MNIRCLRYFSKKLDFNDIIHYDYNKIHEFYRESLKDTRENTRDTKENTVDTKENSRDTRENTISTREGTVDTKENSRDTRDRNTRENTISTRENTVDTKENTVDTREVTDDDRKEKYDSELLVKGDNRNVIDKYKYWKMSEIIKDLKENQNEFHVAIENIKNDFNIGSIVRTANAFNASKIHIVGHKHWNRRGAMVTDKYSLIEYHKNINDLVEFTTKHGLELIGIDNINNSKNIKDYKLPLHCVLLFGQESVGLSPLAQQAVKTCLHIPQYGSTRSINVGAAASIAMYHWITCHKK